MGSLEENMMRRWIWMWSAAAVVLLNLVACAPVAVVGGGACAACMIVREKPVGESLCDSTMAVRVRKAIYRVNPEWTARVSINVQEKEVLLTGTLPSVEDCVAVEQAVWKVKHVCQVYNDIQVSDRAPLRTYLPDAYITAQAKTRLLGVRHVRSMNYSIKTVGGVIYVFGIARSAEERERVLEALARVRGAQRVMSYIRQADKAH